MELIISKLEGYSGLRLLNNKPLQLRSGINLLVGRNGSGKSNFIWLLQSIAIRNLGINNRIESSFVDQHIQLTKDKEGTDPCTRFGQVPIIEYSFNNSPGKVFISLENVPEDYVLHNIQKPGTHYRNHIEINMRGPELDFHPILNSRASVNMDYSGSLHPNFFSKQNDRHHISSMLNDSTADINNFIERRILDFVQSDEFKSSIKELEKSINDKLHRFLGNTSKSISLIADSEYPLRTDLYLFDSQNYIKSEDVSTGEAVLLNLIVSLSQANEVESDILSFDEPELHMHDDMVKVFVEEILDIQDKYPDQIIIVATHSTSLIEELALLGKERVNLITFDREKNITNASKDIELIEALNRNGVWFSPLMLTKKPNLFIENQGVEGFKYRDFFRLFFQADECPNIIPVGTSGNVEQVDSFTSIFEDIMETTDVKSWGIRDGDIWIKQDLVGYIKSEIDLYELVEVISNYSEAYIPSTKPNCANQFYFNFWEIENLFLMSEILGCWTLNGISLTLEGYKEILTNNREVLFNQYIDTFYKAVVKIRMTNSGSAEDRLQTTKSKWNEILTTISNSENIEKRINRFIEEVLSQNLMSWVPGKEVKKLLVNEGYLFDPSNFDFRNTEIGGKIRKILESPESLVSQNQ